MREVPLEATVTSQQSIKLYITGIKRYGEVGRRNNCFVGK